MLGLVGMEELQLGKSLLHLVNGASTVDELDGVLRLGESIAGYEREESDGLACPSRHFQKAVTFGIQSSLKFEHVCVLFWVDVVVREIDGDIFEFEDHASSLIAQLWFKRVSCDFTSIYKQKNGCTLSFSFFSADKYARSCTRLKL